MGEFKEVAQLGLELLTVLGQEELQAELIDDDDGLLLPLRPADLADLAADRAAQWVRPGDLGLDGRGLVGTADASHLRH